MIYPPEAAAEAILFAAEYPKRDMYIGSQAKAIAMLGALFPRLTDRLMEKIMCYSQHAERPSKPREESALYHAGYGMHDRGTNKGWLRRSRCYYVKATKRPAVTAAVIAGLAAWGMMKRRK